MESLLDVNMLIALLDEDHPEHARVKQWFDDNLNEGWVTCPLTENGCVRILSQPRYPNSMSVREAAERLRAVKAIAYYDFVPDDISLFDNSIVDIRMLSGHRQLTDIYLLALAVKHDLRFVTLDTRVRLEAVAGASPNNLVII